MKKISTIALLLGALCSAAVLNAHPGHDHLTVISKEFTREFTDRDTGGVVTVIWTHLGTQGQYPDAQDRYQCVIRQTKDTKDGYSLYNLEIQGRRWEVEVIETSHTQAVFTAGTAAPISTDPTTKIKTLPEVAKGWWNPKKPDKLFEDRVAFIKFTGPECILEVTSKRRRHSRGMPFTTMVGMVSSHDATPPPPDGGGEN